MTRTNPRPIAGEHAAANAFTPGPWRYNAENFDGVVFHYEKTGEHTARHHALARSVYGTANARLIAAAPELLEALQLWLAYDNLDEADFSQVGPMLHYARAIEATRAAIAKARGETA